MKVLRKECPWDREQTLRSLRRHTLEETHEVLEAIDAAERGDWSKLRDELGDLLLQVVFYAEIASEHGAFNLDDVVDALVGKMIDRHPHVFDPAGPDGSVDPRKAADWERMKSREQTDRQSRMDGLPPLPALALASKIQSRAATVGFDWDRAEDVLGKIREELDEFAHEVRARDKDGSRIEDEFGDLLFTLVNLARKLGIDAELALMRTNRKFIERFRRMERLARERDLDLSGCAIETLERLYGEAKHEEQP